MYNTLSRGHSLQIKYMSGICLESILFIPRFFFYVAHLFFFMQSLLCAKFQNDWTIKARTIYKYTKYR